MGWFKNRFGNKPHNPPTLEENWTVAGSGNLLGHEWSNRKDVNGPDRAIDLAWLGGFFSGVSLAENFTFLTDTEDLTAAIDWMDQRLMSNPEERVSQAAAQLAAQLLHPERQNPF